MEELQMPAQGEIALREIIASTAVGDYIVLDIESDMSTLGGFIESIEELAITFAFLGVALRITPQADAIICSSPFQHEKEPYTIAAINIDRFKPDDEEPMRTEEGGGATGEPYDDSRLYL